MSPRVKWLERETKLSSPSNAEVKNAWSFTSRFPTRLHGVVLRPRFSLFFSLFPCEIVTNPNPTRNVLVGNNLPPLSLGLIIFCALNY
jgi:hypothetical protein